MTVFSKIFSKKEEAQVVQNIQPLNNEKEEGITYSDWGFRKASAHQGSNAGLDISLQSVYLQRIKELTSNLQQNDKFHKQAELRIVQLEGESEQFVSKQSRLLQELKLEEQKIEESKQKINEIKAHPEAVTGNRGDKVSLIIGAIIILFMTIYLFVFYSSASYSAMFREFTSDDTVTKAIFDPQAVARALQEGVMELVLILTIPFVFLGFGYVIHSMTADNKGSSVVRYGKITALYIMTFIFDTILAYKIDESLYQLTAGPNTPPYSFLLAFMQPGFWLIIFAGFVVYVIWGIIFGYLMEAYNRLDAVHTAIKAIEERIVHAKKQCNDFKQAIEEVEHKKTQLEIQIKQERCNLQKLVYSPNEITREINNFFDGWAKWLINAGLDQAVVNRQRTTVNDFIAKYLTTQSAAITQSNIQLNQAK